MRRILRVAATGGRAPPPPAGVTEALVVVPENDRRPAASVDGMLRDLRRHGVARVAVAAPFRSVADVDATLSLPVDAIVLGSLALTDPSVIDFCVATHGAARIGVAAGFRRRMDGTCEVWTGDGQAPTGRDLAGWARQASKRGAGELWLFDLDRAAGGAAADESTIAEVVNAVRVPVLLGGGITTAADAAMAERIGAAGVVAEPAFFVPSSA